MEFVSCASIEKEYSPAGSKVDPQYACTGKVNLPVISAAADAGTAVAVTTNAPNKRNIVNCFTFFIIDPPFVNLGAISCLRRPIQETKNY